MKLKRCLAIVCIAMLFATCPALAQVNNDAYSLTRAQLETVKMTIEENKVLKSELARCDSVGLANEKINSAAIKILQTDLKDKKSELQLKEEQIFKLEALPRQTVVVDSRKWWEVPAAILGGVALGVVVQRIFSK